MKINIDGCLMHRHVRIHEWIQNIYKFKGNYEMSFVFIATIRTAVKYLFLSLRSPLCCGVNYVCGSFLLHFTPPRNRGGVIFSLQFVYVSVCVRVFLIFSCEQNYSRMDVPIWTRFSLNGYLPHWLKPYWNWWPWVKGQGHGDVLLIISS